MFMIYFISAKILKKRKICIKKKQNLSSPLCGVESCTHLWRKNHWNGIRKEEDKTYAHVPALRR